MRVLVTGHQGYLGTVMCQLLAAAGHDVAGLDTGWFAPCLLGPSAAEPPLLGRDIREVRPADLAGFDAVVHLAALSNDALGAMAPELTWDINHRAAVALARAARSAGVVRFLYSSTCSVYGASDTGQLVAEDAPLVPVSAYAMAKVQVERDLHTLADERFIPVYLRNATAFGHSPRLRTDIVLNDLVASAVLTGVVRVTSDGTPWRPLVHLRDIAQAFLAALTAPAEAVRDQPINVGNESLNLRVAEIAELVGRSTGAAVQITGENGADPRSYRVDFRRIRELLPSFRTQWDLERGVAELVHAYRQHGLTPADRQHRFMRLPWLRSLISAGRLDDALRWRAEPSQPKSQVRQ